MDSTLIIVTSVMMQLVAAIFALTHIRDIELRRTWLAIGAALMLMCIPRTITLIKLLTGEITQPPALESELVALDVSFLMGIGIAYAARLFRSLKRAHADLLKSQQSLIDSESRIRSLFNNIPDAILVMDRMGFVRNANAAAGAMIGAECEQVCGRHYTELPVFKPFVDLARREGTTTTSLEGAVSFESSFVNGRGQALCADVRGFDLRIGNELFRTWILTDTTEKRGLRAQAERLESQLRHAERLQTVGTLAGGIAHDFNNILAPIVGYTELALKDCGTSSGSRAHLEQVIRGALRARDLVKQILTFSRQSARQTIPMQLQSLVKETLILIRASLPTTIEIRTEIDANCQVVLGDPGQIHQVLMNLCTNAFHAMRERGGTLTVRLCERNPRQPARLTGQPSAGARYACLSVEDSGCGIDVHTLERIFEPFFTTKSEGQGSGLGLSVVHGIVTAHDGTIEVESTPGVGTRFDVFLPLDLEHVAEVAPPVESAVTGSERLLIVDDEPVVAELVSELLEAHGFNAVCRTSSTEALQAFRAHPRAYDAVITDQTMPGLTGVELAAEIKRMRPDIPVILMTGFSEKISAENFRSFGVDGYLLKPVLASAITRMVAKLTRGAESEKPVS